MTKTQETKENSQVYEVGFHIAPIVGEENLSHEVSLIRDVLDNAKAEVVSEDFPRLVSLAYPLSKVIKGTKRVFNEAYFGWIKFEVTADAAASIQSEVEKLENILRMLLIKTVRENTLHGAKFATKEQMKGVSKKDEEATVVEETVKEEEKEKLTPEELDKTIDDLVV
jgi:ribosomal protein S6